MTEKGPKTIEMYLDTFSDEKIANKTMPGLLIVKIRSVQGGQIETQKFTKYIRGKKQKSFYLLGLQGLEAQCSCFSVLFQLSK